MQIRPAVLSVVLLVLLWSTPPAASAASRPDPAASAASSLELFVGQFRPDEQSSHSVLGARVGNRIRGRFGIEISLDRLDFDGGSNLFADLSFQIFLDQRPKITSFVFAGPGRVNVEIDESSVESGIRYASTATAHAGFGLEIALGSRAYLRPDARFRWYRSGKGGDLETSVALGFRFGG